MVVDLLASPYVGWQRGLDFASVARVVGRIDQYSEDGVEFAWEVLADTATMAQVSALRSDGASEDEVTAFIDGALIEKAEAAQKRAVEAEARTQEAIARESEIRQTARAEEERAKRLKADHDDERRRREGMESDLDRERQRRTDEVAEATSSSAELVKAAEASLTQEREAREALEANIKESRRKLRIILRIGLACSLAILAVGFGSVLMLTQSVHGFLPKLFVALGAFLILLVSINIAFSEKWAGRIFVYIGLVIGAASIAVPIISSGH
jgi:ABC-type multidrug transport system fused ATPase/permease subunit